MDEFVDPQTVLKDVDFQNLEKDGIVIYADLGINIKEETDIKNLMILSVISDVEYLKKQNIMDYSLIIAKVDLNKLTKNQIIKMRKRKVLLKSTKDCGYIIFLLDIFQPWNFSKKLERYAKILQKCNAKLEISACSPVPYAKRFENNLEMVKSSIRVVE